MNTSQEKLEFPGGISLQNPIFMLAPMEGLTNFGMRNLIVDCGGVDTVATEFVRVTSPKQTIRPFQRHPDTVLQIQLMAGEKEVLAGIILHLKEQGILQENDWIDLNVGCPSRRVNANGAGAALLKTPKELLAIVDSMREVHRKGPLSIKTRLGFDSSEAFPELLQHLRDAPIDLITIHARSRCASYSTEQLEIEKLSLAVKELPYPVIGNGDVTSPHSALQMISKTGVAGCMIGRGAITDPFIFSDIKQALAGVTNRRDPEQRKGKLLQFALSYLQFLKTREQTRRRPQSGQFKEFATWFSRNPLIGREFFSKVKRLKSLQEIERFLEGECCKPFGSSHDTGKGPELGPRAHN